MIKLSDSIATGINALLSPYGLDIQELLACWEQRNGIVLPKIDRYICVDEACKLSGFSRQYLWKALHDGKLKGRKTGDTRQSKTLISSQSLEDWLQAMPEWKPGTGKKYHRTPVENCGGNCGDSSFENQKIDT